MERVGNYDEGGFRKKWLIFFWENVSLIATAIHKLRGTHVSTVWVILLPDREQTQYSDDWEVLLSHMINYPWILPMADIKLWLNSDARSFKVCICICIHTDIHNLYMYSIHVYIHMCMIYIQNVFPAMYLFSFFHQIWSQFSHPLSLNWTCDFLWSVLQKG